MYPFTKKARLEKKERMTVDKALKANEEMFEDLMKSFGFKKNGKEDGPEWCRDGTFFDPCETVEEDE